jgi:iron complex outermembrane receptor protein
MFGRDRIIYALVSTALVAALSGEAAAQDAGQAGASGPGEIIVTARKRQESVLNVPVVAVALTQERLEVHQVQDLKDISKMVTGLSFGQTLGATGVQVSLRGIGTTTLNSGIDASVALNVDGMVMTQGISYGGAMFDVAQVEVLKGPQSLFFGKNSPGGVIAVRTADPGNDPEIVARAGYEFGAEEKRVELILSGPVTDDLGLRLAAAYDDQEGFYRNRAVATPGLGGVTPRRTKFPQSENYVVRGTALWQPSTQFDARLKATLTHDRTEGGPALQLLSCPDGTGAVPGFDIPFVVGDECKRNRTINIVELDPAAFAGKTDGSTLFNDTDEKYGTFEFNYRPWTDVTLTSLTGYYDLDFKSQQPIPSSAAGPAAASFVDLITRRDFTQELRANSDFSAPLNFTAGFFYHDGKITHANSLPSNTALGRPLPPVLSKYKHTVDIKTVSAFGQVRWNVLPELELAAGARWTNEKRNHLAVDLRSGSPVVIPLAVPKIESDNISPEFTITYKPQPDVTLFASYKKAFKSGSFQLTGPTPGADVSFDDERIEGGEIGLKSRLLDRNLTLELAGYYYDYAGLQVGANEPGQGNVPVLRTVNAGGAEIYGVDLDLNYRVPQVEGLSVRASVNWNHARFTELNGIPCWGGQTVAEGCDQLLNPNTGLFTSQDLAGEPLPKAPNWQANFGFQYETDIGRDFTLTVANSNQFSSKYLAYLGLRDDFYQPSFFKTDWTLALKDRDGKWEVALIGKNLTNELTSGLCQATNAQNSILGGYVTGGTTRGPAGVDEVACYMDRGRELWVRLTLRPFG